MTCNYQFATSTRLHQSHNHIRDFSESSGIPNLVLHVVELLDSQTNVVALRLSFKAVKPKLNGNGLTLLIHSVSTPHKTSPAIIQLPGVALRDGWY